MHRWIGAALGAVVAIAGTETASAADMPVKAPVSRVSNPYNWNGFYIGGHVGYGFGVAETSAPVDTDFFGGRGFLGGVLGGYNYMITPRALIGVEGDFTWSDVTYSALAGDGGGTVLSFSLKQKEAYSVRARFGYLLAPETLLYGTAGWSWSKFNYFLNVNTFGTDTDTRWLNGPQIGVGVETMLAPGWIGRLEYLHSFYDSSSFNAPVVNAFLGTGVDARPNVGVGRLALIYNFGPGAPVPWQMPAPTPSWNGVYVGGGIGAGVANAKFELNNAPPNFIDGDGVGIPAIWPTALLGYNWRVAQRWVIGAEGEIAPGISTADFSLDWTAALRGRVGYLLTPSTMVFGSAGWLTSGIRTSSVVGGAVVIPSQRVNGAQIGGGIETAVTEHWLARFDYQYAFTTSLHDVTFNFTPFGTTGTVDARAQAHCGRLALVYLFDTR